MKSVAFCTLGCKVNQYETDAMEEIFQKGGYEIRDFHEKADIYVINTCTVTNMADRKSRQMLHRARKKNPEAVIVAAGCYVQAAKEAAEADEAIDLIVVKGRFCPWWRILPRSGKPGGAGHSSQMEPEQPWSRSSSRFPPAGWI